MTDAPESPPPDVPPARRILVVDDEPLKRITLQIELSEAGYEVYDAADAPAAMAILDRRMMDVVVTDVRMAGPSGLDLLDYVKARRPETVVVLMTAYGAVETAVQAMKHGAYDYILKPFTTEELLAKLRGAFAAGPAAGRVDGGMIAGDGGAAAASMAEPEAAQRPLETLGLGAPALELPQSIGQGLSETLADIERRVILMALRECGGNQARAAQRLGIPRTTLRDKMARYSIPVS